MEEGSFKPIKLVILNQKAFFQLLRAYESMVEEIGLYIEPNTGKIRVRELDLAEVRMLDACFQTASWEVPQAAKVKFKIQDLIRMIPKNPPEEGSLTITIEADNVSFKTDEYSFKISSFLEENKLIPLPTFTSKVKVKTGLKEFAEALEKTSKVSDVFKIRAENDVLEVKATGEVSEVAYRIPAELYSGEPNIVGKYENNRMLKVIKPIKRLVGKGKILIDFTNEMPIQIDFGVDFSLFRLPIETLMFYQAPRLERE